MLRSYNVPIERHQRDIVSPSTLPPPALPPDAPLSPAGPPLPPIQPPLPRPPCASGVSLSPSCVHPLPTGSQNSIILLKFTFVSEHKLTLLQCIAYHDASRGPRPSLQALHKVHDNFVDREHFHVRLGQEREADC